MIDSELEQNLNNAFKLAHTQKHEFVTVEHLLLALLENSDSLDLLSSNKIDVEQLRTDLEKIGKTMSDEWIANAGSVGKKIIDAFKAE